MGSRLTGIGTSVLNSVGLKGYYEISTAFVLYSRYLYQVNFSFVSWSLFTRICWDEGIFPTIICCPFFFFQFYEEETRNIRRDTDEKNSEEWWKSNFRGSNSWQESHVLFENCKKDSTRLKYKELRGSFVCPLYLPKKKGVFTFTFLYHRYTE